MLTISRVIDTQSRTQIWQIWPLGLPALLTSKSRDSGFELTRRKCGLTCSDMRTSTSISSSLPFAYKRTNSPKSLDANQQMISGTKEWHPKKISNRQEHSVA